FSEDVYWQRSELKSGQTFRIDGQTSAHLKFRGTLTAAKREPIFDSNWDIMEDGVFIVRQKQQKSRLIVTLPIANSSQQPASGSGSNDGSRLLLLPFLRATCSDEVEYLDCYGEAGCNWTKVLNQSQLRQPLARGNISVEHRHQFVGLLLPKTGLPELVRVSSNKAQHLPVLVVLPKLNTHLTTGLHSACNARAACPNANDDRRRIPASGTHVAIAVVGAFLGIGAIGILVRFVVYKVCIRQTPRIRTPSEPMNQEEQALNPLNNDAADAEAAHNGANHAAVHNDADTATVHNDADTATVHNDADTATVHNDADTATVHNDADTATVHNDADTATVHNGTGTK
uniref:MAM domain-containing protein n=1 Tax=Macrostomum lignano TaxID=282301 RepID=A0A1I8HZJ6_9PLAT